MRVAHSPAARFRALAAENVEFRAGLRVHCALVVSIREEEASAEEGGGATCDPSSICVASRADSGPAPDATRLGGARLPRSRLSVVAFPTRPPACCHPQEKIRKEQAPDAARCPDSHLHRACARQGRTRCERRSCNAESEHPPHRFHPHRLARRRADALTPTSSTQTSGSFFIDGLLAGFILVSVNFAFSWCSR